MKILFIAAEVTPIVKVGGLADVVGALPKALAALGHDVRVMIPNYQIINQTQFPRHPVKTNIRVPWEGDQTTVDVLQGTLPSSRVPVYFLQAPAAIQHPEELAGLAGVYANSSDPELLRREMERFVFFSRAVTSSIPHLDWLPDIIHLHDWNAALVAPLARQDSLSIPTVLTIHNLQNQGRWNPDEVSAWLDVNQSDELWSIRDHLGNLNLLQLGIHAAGAVNTVSPTYAKEVLTAEYGEGLEKDLQQRPNGVMGILNGLDTDTFNPATDPTITMYSVDSVQEGKEKNKQALLAELHLPSTNQPLFVSVGRLSEQKGYTLIGPLIEKFAEQSIPLIILGTGIPEVTRELEQLAQQFPKTFHLIPRFDAPLAQRLYAAGDFFLMPSKFEPCGLGQMIAMRYGTLPIARATGGLIDTIINLSDHERAGTGFLFNDFSSQALWAAIESALALYQQSNEFSAARQRAMTQDFSWTQSAKTYLQFYGHRQR